MSLSRALLRCPAERRRLRSALVSDFSKVRLFAPNARGQQSHAGSEARDETKHEQYDHEAADGTVEIQHERTSNLIAVEDCVEHEGPCPFIVHPRLLLFIQPGARFGGHHNLDESHHDRDGKEMAGKQSARPPVH